MMTNHDKHPLDERTIQIIKATVPVLEEHGETITTLFYKRLFENYPELKNLFNQTHQRAGDQPRALANMVYAAARHIENLGLGPSSGKDCCGKAPQSECAAGALSDCW